MADLLHDLGGIPARRVLLFPTPGTATEADALDLAGQPRKRLIELVEGTLVEKAMGFEEAYVATRLVSRLEAFVGLHRLGMVVGDGGLMRLSPGLLRIPDVSFTGWDRLPAKNPHRGRFAPFAPDLAIEILSRGNTRREIARKRREYFAHGSSLVWVINPRQGTAEVWTSADDSTILGSDEVLPCGELLPGFRLPLAELFAEAERPEPH